MNSYLPRPDTFRWGVKHIAPKLGGTRMWRWKTDFFWGNRRFVYPSLSSRLKWSMTLVPETRKLRLTGSLEWKLFRETSCVPHHLRGSDHRAIYPFSSRSSFWMPHSQRSTTGNFQRPGNAFMMIGITWRKQNNLGGWRMNTADLLKRICADASSKNVRSSCVRINLHSTPLPLSNPVCSLVHRNHEIIQGNFSYGGIRSFLGPDPRGDSAIP